MINLWAGAVVPPQCTGEQISLRAAVVAVVPLADFSGAVTPVDSDPRFALTMLVESAAPTVAEFHQGSVVTFAIHSPALLFGNREVPGKTYDFLLHRWFCGGKVKFSGLRRAT
jgi:hypothetical protein